MKYTKNVQPCSAFTSSFPELLLSVETHLGFEEVQFGNEQLEAVHQKLLAPHTSGLRDVPRCGALSLLQKTPHYRGDPADYAERKIVRSGGDWWWHLTSFRPILLTRKLKADTEIKSRQIWGRAEWYYFCERQCAPSPRWATKGQSAP
jgi:hypothetical protein